MGSATGLGEVYESIHCYGLLAESNLSWHVCMDAEGTGHQVDRVRHVPANLH